MKNLSEKGFSLVEIMLATSALAVVSLGFMQMNLNMKKGQVSAETKFEEMELKRNISTMLTDADSCKNTLAGTNIGTEFSAIKNKGNTSVYQKGNSYGGGSVKLLSMSTQDLGIPNADGTRTIKLTISYQRLKKMAEGGVKSFSLQVNAAAAGPTGIITKCFVDTEAIVSSANKATCTSLEGIWNNALSTCSLSGEKLCLSMKGVWNNADSTCAQLGKVITCPDGETIKSIALDGTPTCVSTIAVYQ